MKGEVKPESFSHNENLWTDVCCAKRREMPENCVQKSEVIQGD